MITLPGWRGWRQINDGLPWHAFDSMASQRQALCGMPERRIVKRKAVALLESVPRGVILCTTCWREWPGGRHSDPPPGLLTAAKARLLREIRKAGLVG